MTTTTCMFCKELFDVMYNGQKFCSVTCRNRARIARKRQGKAGEIFPAPITPHIDESLHSGSIADQDETLTLLNDAITRKWPAVALPAFSLPLLRSLEAMSRNPHVKPRLQQRAASLYYRGMEVLDRQLRTNLDIDKFELVRSVLPSHDGDVRDTLLALMSQDENTTPEQVCGSSDQGQVQELPSHPVPGTGSTPPVEGQGPTGPDH